MDDIYRGELDKSLVVHANKEKEEVTIAIWMGVNNAFLRASSMEEEKR
jgi:hypothetical protein